MGSSQDGSSPVPSRACAHLPRGAPSDYGPGLTYGESGARRNQRFGPRRLQHHRSDSGAGSSATAPGSTGTIPAGMVVVQVPTIVGPGQYCLISKLVPLGTVLPPFNPHLDDDRRALPGLARGHRTHGGPDRAAVGQVGPTSRPRAHRPARLRDHRPHRLPRGSRPTRRGRPHSPTPSDSTRSLPTPRQRGSTSIGATASTPRPRRSVARTRPATSPTCTSKPPSPLRSPSPSTGPAPGPIRSATPAPSTASHPRGPSPSRCREIQTPTAN